VLSAFEGYISSHAPSAPEEIPLGILDFFRRGKNPEVDDQVDRHHVDSLDYFKEKEKGEFVHCPECAKAQRHVRLVKTEGEEMECPECHYLHEVRRV